MAAIFGLCCASWVASALLLLCPGLVLARTPLPRNRAACLPCLLGSCSWHDLPGVDPSNESSAKRTLVLAAVRRFLALRQEVRALLDRRAAGPRLVRLRSCGALGHAMAPQPALFVVPATPDRSV